MTQIDNNTVIVLYPSLSSGENTPEDLLDTMRQVRLVSRTLSELGYATVEKSCSLNLEELSVYLKETKPRFCFNLVEYLSGDTRFNYFVAVLLEHLNIPYTSSGSENLIITSSKILTKEKLLASGFDTAPYCYRNRFWGGNFEAGLYILKPVWEEASVGIDDESVVEVGDFESLRAKTEETNQKTHSETFAEKFLDGREFNVSIVTDGKTVEILPVAEILFRDFPKYKPRIVGYRAKWKEESFEFQNTPRTFEFALQDSPLIERLQTVSRQICEVFGLRGYIRIDYRTVGNRVFVLEININPCLSEDAGFYAAVIESGQSFASVMKKIIPTSAL